jgi:hypothetical protein
MTHGEQGKCGVRVVGPGVDSFYTVESEEDLLVVIRLIRKAAYLRAPDHLERSAPENTAKRKA